MALFRSHQDLSYYSNLADKSFLKTHLKKCFLHSSVLRAFIFFVSKIDCDGSNTCLHCFCRSHHHPATNAIGQTRDAQINNFQHGEKPIFKVQVLWRRFGTVIFYKREAACSQYVIVGSLDSPVKV